MLTVDRPIALWAANSQSPQWRAFFESITDIGKAATFVYPGILLLIGARILFLQSLPHRIAYLYRRMADIALYLLVTMALCGLVIHSLKLVVARLRPKHLLNDAEAGFFYYGSEWTNNSFPSGHAQTIFNVAMVLTMVFPKSGYVVLPFAGFIALSRVMVSAHYPSDVLLGSFIGIIVAVLVYERWFTKLKSPVYPPALA
jgi:membrane-associated phospholipid phosphatase